MEKGEGVLLSLWQRRLLGQRTVEMCLNQQDSLVQERLGG
jgi:hypothetical protein